ncbi:biosynthetic-type acetolactate synthase large subunit [Treponema sp. HNW]|uniref:biosynthetic-type acetolactate synthase large subunit n=1 Tax=Treponema sp. HNW TaxID=3116654 RepID=UPI003D119841
MKLTGAQIVIECLIEQGTDTVFGYPGGAILHIYDELYKNRHRIRHILTAHEQGAAHAADGYSRSTGKTGVVLATSGPGAANLVTGIATAYMDSVPLVAITCNVATHLLGKDSFQEIDITGITTPVTKHSYIVRNIEQLAAAVREAFIIASMGRPGPVLIDIPKDVTAAVTEYEPVKKSDSTGGITDGITELSVCIHKLGALARAANPPPVSAEKVKCAADLINRAERPVICAGGGVLCADAWKELRLLAEKASIPVCQTLMGKSAFPAQHELNTGMVGMHGTKAANCAVNKSDLIIALGMRFSDRVISNPSTFARDSTILHIDIDAAELNKNVPAACALAGDVKALLKRIIPLVAEKEKSPWNAQIEEWKKHIPSMYAKKTKLHPKFVFEYIHKKIGETAIITTEVGQHQMWASLFYPFSLPHSFLTSGGLGTMGYGTGAAIGAQTGKPDRPVVHIAGDGSFRMNCAELATIEYYKLPIIIIVVNNGTLGMVRQWQKLFYDKRYSQTTLDRGPDFVKLAEAYNIKAFRAHDEAEFASAFDKALELALYAEKREPVLIDSYIDIDENVLPMVPAGKAIDDTLLEIEND